MKTKKFALDLVSLDLHKRSLVVRIKVRERGYEPGASIHCECVKVTLTSHGIG